MAKTEYKVGETFQFGLKTLKCVEHKSCNCYECALQEIYECNYFVGECDEFNRTDKKNVIFIEVEETDKQE